MDCKIKQSILREINPAYSVEELLLKLKLQYFGHLIRRANSLQKTLMLGKTEGKKRRGQHGDRCTVLYILHGDRCTVLRYNK